MTDRTTGHPTTGAHPAREPLDPELERRIAALEAGSDAGSDFDARSWFWMLLLGVVAPAALLVWGWLG